MNMKKKMMQNFYLHSAHIHMLEGEHVRTGAPKSEIVRRAIEMYMFAMENRRKKGEEM